MSCAVPEHCRRFITSQMRSETAICLQQSDLRHPSVQGFPSGLLCHLLTLYESSIFGLLDCYPAFFGIIRIAFVYILEIV